MPLGTIRYSELAQVLNKVYTGRFRPEFQPLTLFINTIFNGKCSPFLYLLFTNTPFTCLATTGAQADGLLA